jgi:hypothetical protein
MHRLGKIVRLQIQRSPLKVATPEGAVHPRRYDPAPLLEVPALLLTPDGVLGLLPEERIVDVHHRDHRDSRNADVNGVSIGFTTHYAAMRERFGEHLSSGIAGENVLVEAAAAVPAEALQGGVAVRTRDGRLVHLSSVVVAEPCVEFTRFALRFGNAEPSGGPVTDGLRFLRDGMRGFYASYAGESIVLRTGDEVFTLDDSSPRRA